MLDLLRTVFKYKEKRSPDKLGRYPEALHTSAMPERRYLWSSRLLVIFAALSICFNIMLASSIYVMLPQKNASPRTVTHNARFSVMPRQPSRRLCRIPRFRRGRPPDGTTAKAAMNPNSEKRQSSCPQRVKL